MDKSEMWIAKPNQWEEDIHKRVTKAYNKKVRPRVFQEGDLVLRKILSLPDEHHNKWAPNYKGL